MLEDIIHQMNDAGLRVFPLLGSHDLDGEKLDEKEAFKRPRHTGWQHTPDSWSDEQMEVLFETGQFDTGYGIVCRDLIVIDVDPRNGGLKSLEALLEQVPEIAGAGMIVETGERPDPALDDERRRYYRLTAYGSDVLAAEAQRLSNLVHVARRKRLLGVEGA